MKSFGDQGLQGSGQVFRSAHDLKDGTSYFGSRSPRTAPRLPEFPQRQRCCREGPSEGDGTPGAEDPPIRCLNLATTRHSSKPGVGSFSNCRSTSVGQSRSLDQGEASTGSAGSRYGPLNAPSMRATRSPKACRSSRTTSMRSPRRSMRRSVRVASANCNGTRTPSRATPTAMMATVSALTCHLFRRGLCVAPSPTRTPCRTSPPIPQ